MPSTTIFVKSEIIYTFIYTLSYTASPIQPRDISLLYPFTHTFTLTVRQATTALQYPIYTHRTSFSSLSEVFLTNERGRSSLLWHSNTDVAEMWLSCAKLGNIVGENKSESKSIRTHVHNIWLTGFRWHFRTSRDLPFRTGLLEHPD